MKSIRFEIEISNDEAEDLTDNQKEILGYAIERHISDMNGNSAILEVMVRGGTLNRTPDISKVQRFIVEYGYEVEISKSE